MNTTLKRMLRVFCLGAVLTTAQASEVGHFAPGVANIRDFTVPEPGFYGVLYNYCYSADRVNDADGDELNSIGSLDLDVDVDVYCTAPTFIWVSTQEILGGKYGAYVSPSFGNTSVGASLANAAGAGRDAEESEFGLGDLYVQPLWLGWNRKNWDAACGYGVYAPIGKYDTETVTIPDIGSVEVEAADNIGYGFWTHQFQGAFSAYPWEDRRMAVAFALTYEIHGEKEDFDLTPGDDLTLNWGVSQYLPLKEDQSLLLEVGPAGYSSWQVTEDDGSDAAPTTVEDEVHAVGAQVGVTSVPKNATLNFHYFYEYAADDRFQGQSIGLNLAKKF
jgi:hypothetical protein